MTERSPFLAGCVKAVLPEDSAVSLQDRDDQEAAELGWSLFSGLEGKGKVGIALFRRGGHIQHTDGGFLDPPPVITIEGRTTVLKPCMNSMLHGGV